MQDHGVGYLPVRAAPYDGAYFEKYRGYSETDFGRRLNDARLAFVWRYWHGPLVDVGIGCGQFVASHPTAAGFDVNPAGIEWLRERGRFLDPYVDPVDVATFWDSLEHIADPAPLLANVRRFVFVSLPIFDDLAHVLRSKHFRPDEHCWYFTAPGFVAFMAAHGFRCLERNRIESELGREDIDSFAFERVAGGR